MAIAIFSREKLVYPSPSLQHVAFIPHTCVHTYTHAHTPALLTEDWCNEFLYLGVWLFLDCENCCRPQLLSQMMFLVEGIINGRMKTLGDNERKVLQCSVSKLHVTKACCLSQSYWPITELLRCHGLMMKCLLACTMVLWFFWWIIFEKQPQSS